MNRKHNLTPPHWIDLYCQSYKLTRYELSKDTGIPQNTMSMWVKNRTKVSDTHVKFIIMFCYGDLLSVGDKLAELLRLERESERIANSIQYLQLDL